MLKFRSFALAFLLLGPVALLSAAEKKEERDDDEKPKAKAESVEIPDAAKAALKKLAGKSKIESIVIEGEDVKVFEALWKSGEETKEAAVTALGDLVELEEEVEADEVPKPVKKAGASLKAKSGAVTYVKKVMTFYEVEVGSGEKAKSILVDATGRKVEVKYEEEEEDEDDEAEEKSEKSSTKKGKASKSEEEDEDEEKEHKKVGKSSEKKVKASKSEEDEDDEEKEKVKKPSSVNAKASKVEKEEEDDDEKEEKSEKKSSKAKEDDDR